MNKAFLREPDQQPDLCPRCGAAGLRVSAEVLARYLTEAQRSRLSATAAWFCPTPKCEAAYFDLCERIVPADQLALPAYPKDPDAPLCACFGFTADEVERDLDEGGVARTRAAVERARSPEAQCASCAPDGQSCLARIQQYFMHRKQARSARG